jgi:diaminopimelate decarboxylase
MKLKLILEPGTSLFKDSTVFVGGVVDIQESADDLDNKIFING